VTMCLLSLSFLPFFLFEYKYLYIYIYSSVYAIIRSILCIDYINYKERERERLVNKRPCFKKVTDRYALH
jgi:hypothetical protein